MTHCTPNSTCNALATIWTHILGFPALPEWFPLLTFGIGIYLFFSIMFGCPHCFLPNLAWPLEVIALVIEKIKGDFEDE